MSRKADYWGNAPMGSYFHTFKTERVLTGSTPPAIRPGETCFQYIEGFYDPH